MGDAVNYAGAIAQCAVPYGVSDAAPLMQSLDDAAHGILGDAQALAKAAGVTATTVVLEGAAVGAIVNYAKAQNVAAIVMGTRGTEGVERFFLGSTADGVLRSADVPVFVTHPADDAPPPSFKRILVPTDDSDPALAAIAYAIEFAAVEKATVIFGHVIETEGVIEKSHEYGYDGQPMIAEMHADAQKGLDLAVAAAKQRGVEAESFVAEGHPIDAILAAIPAHQADAVVVGTHGRRGLRRLFLGSVAEGVVRQSPVPVAVLRR